MAEQLNIEYILQKISFLEEAIEIILDYNQL